MTDDSISRRRLLGCLGVATTLGLAGCAGDTESTPNVADPDGQFDFTVDHPVDEPKEFSEDHMCGVCSMTVTDYPERNAQVAHEDGVGMMLCSSGCLFAYYVNPTHFDGSSADIAGVWVTDFKTRQLVDGTDAYYVLEYDKERADDPMGVDPRSYADRADAVSYVEKYDELDESDIIGLEDVDADVARIYRESRLP